MQNEGSHCPSTPVLWMPPRTTYLYCAQYLTALSLSPHPTLRSLRGGECLTHPCTPRPSTAPATHAQKCLLSRTKQLGPFQH